MSLFTIQNFCKMDDDSLRQLRLDLGISIPLTSLHRCQSHFSNTARRDPTPYELLLLDRYAKQPPLADRHLVTEITTTSDTVATTLADLMRYRRQQAEPSEHPISLARLSEVMERYLQSTERPTPMEDIRLAFGANRDLVLAADGCAKCADTGARKEDVAVGRRQLSHRPPIKPGDYIFAFFTDHVTDGEAALCRLLLSPAATKAAGAVIPLIDVCPLNRLLTLDTGLSLALEHLAATPEDALEQLTEPRIGALVVADPAVAADLILAANRLGFFPRHLATVTRGTMLQAFMNEKTLVELPLSLIGDLSSARILSASVPYDPNAPLKIDLARIGTCTLGGLRHALIMTEAGENDPYRDALHSVLLSYLHSFAGGAEPRRIRLACRLTLPLSDSRGIGASIAALLGLYRAQAELELFGELPQLIPTDGILSISAVTLSLLPAAPTPQTAVGGGSYIYYLAPGICDDGTIDFDQLRQILTYLTGLRRDGHILAMRPTEGKLFEELSAMSRETSVEYVRRETIASAPGGLLVETDLRISGTLVAKTFARKEPLPEDAPAHGQNAV